MLVSGHSDNRKKATNRNIVIILTSVVCVAVLLGVIVLRNHRPQYSFDMIADKFFAFLTSVFPDERSYIFQRLDGYCMEDEMGEVTFYLNAKYEAYYEDDDEWVKIDEVYYGDKNYSNTYCLSWDDLNGFEEVNEDFKEAVKEGYHKEFTMEEIQNLINAWEKRNDKKYDQSKCGLFFR